MRAVAHVGAVVLALSAVPVAAADVTYLVALRTELRPRTSLPGDVGTTLTGDLALDPNAQISLGVGNGVVSLQYAPTFVWREPQTGGRLLPLQRGRLTWAYRWQRAGLLLSQDGAWGLQDVGSIRAPDGSLPGAVGEVQTLASVPYLRAATLANLEVRPNDTVSFGLSGGYSVSGSPTGSVNGLPLQYGPTAAARLRGRVTRLDTLVTAAAFSQSTFDTGQEQLIASLTEGWDRQVTRTLSLSLAGGAAVTREVVVAPQGIPGTYFEALPVGSVGLNWKDVVAQQPVKFAASVRLSPFADRFTGNIYERLEGRVQADWLAARDWAVTTAASGAYAVPLGRAAQAGDRLVMGEGGVTWTVKQWLLLQASARVLWTEQPRLGIPGQVQAVGAVSVTVREQDSLAW